MEDKSKRIKNPSANVGKKLEALLAENLELNKQILKSVNSTQRYIKFARIISVFKILLILVPLVLALIYVPPFLQKVLGAYNELLGVSPFEFLQDFRDAQ